MVSLPAMAPSKAVAATEVEGRAQAWEGSAVEGAGWATGIVRRRNLDPRGTNCRRRNSSRRAGRSTDLRGSLSRHRSTVRRSMTCPAGSAGRRRNRWNRPGRSRLRTSTGTQAYNSICRWRRSRQFVRILRRCRRCRPGSSGRGSRCHRPGTSDRRRNSLRRAVRNIAPRSKEHRRNSSVGRSTPNPSGSIRPKGRRPSQADSAFELG